MGETRGGGLSAHQCAVVWPGETGTEPVNELNVLKTVWTSKVQYKPIAWIILQLPNVGNMLSCLLCGHDPCPETGMLLPCSNRIYWAGSVGTQTNSCRANKGVRFRFHHHTCACLLPRGSQQQALGTSSIPSPWSSNLLLAAQASEGEKCN